MDDLLLKLLHVGIVDILVDGIVQSLLNGLFLIHGLAVIVIGNRLNLVDYINIPGRGYLGAVLPVSLVSVIFRRIMAGRDHDAGRTSQLPYRIGQYRCGTQRSKYICLYAVCVKAQSSFISELGRHAP